MAQYTEQELAEIGRKLLVQKERDKMKAQAYNQALRRLIQNYRTEFDQLLEQARAEYGIH